MYGGAGTVSGRCLRNATPPREVVDQRSLTSQEVTRLVGLVRQSNLFGGGYIGRDSTAMDGIFETLTVSGAAGTGVLVTSDNSSFSTGPRHDLLQVLQAMLQELLTKTR